MPDNLQMLPKIRDGLSFVYLEYGHLERDGSSLQFENKRDTLVLPAAALAVILLGPGTTATHAAMTVAAQNGCSVVWVGEDATRFYACGMGETRKSARLLRQAVLWGNPATRLRVVRKMYEIRFPEPLDPGLTLEQIRGKEGVRVRETYARASRETGVKWEGRNYERGDWKSADPINRALSAANACLNGLCHAAIVSAGYSPGLGFVHIGKMLSFVYDVADLYKAEVTIPLAFASVSERRGDLERDVRKRCRSQFHQAHLLDRIVPDIGRVLDMPKEELESTFDLDAALPGWLWDEEGPIRSGVNYGGDDPSERAAED